MEHKEMSEDNKKLCNITKSIQEELQAFTDYICRADCDTENSKLYLHLADEEAKHFAMLVSTLANANDTISKHLETFLGVDPLSVEED